MFSNGENFRLSELETVNKYYFRSMSEKSEFRFNKYLKSYLIDNRKKRKEIEMKEKVLLYSCFADKLFDNIYL